MDDFEFKNEMNTLNNEIDNLEIEEVKEYSNIDITNEPEINTLDEKKKKEKKKLTKKAKIIISIVILLLLIILLVVYFLFIKKPKENKPETETVVFESDNYRYEDGVLKFLDKSDRVIGEYTCENKEVEKCLVSKLDYSSDKFERIKSVNTEGEELSKTSPILLDKYAFVRDGDDLFIYNILKNEKTLTIKSFKYYSMDKPIAVIEDEKNMFGLIELKEDGFDYLIRPSYDNLGIVNTKLMYLVAQDKDKNYIIDSSGKKLSENINANIESVNEKFIVATKNNTYDLYDYEFNELLRDYSYISLHDDVVAVVKENRLYLKDVKMNKLHEDGIRLTNDFYVKSYVYDNDNKLKDTKKCYEITVNNNVASVTVNRDTTNINIIDGSASSKYQYINYFDGKLYFYSDKEKEELIGTYMCSNKNILNQKEDKFKNCHLYTVDDLTTGIYNNNYVFIYDNISEEETKVYLYSLKEKKVKSTYNSLVIINEEELDKDIKHVFTSSSFFLASLGTGNNEGKYGVHEINNVKVQGKVSFIYKSIEKKGSYYIMSTQDDKVIIYNENFNQVSDEFDYVELFENYYVGIKDKKLNVYSYLVKTPKLEKDLDITDNTFKIDFTNGFKVSINENVFEFDSSGKEKVKEVPKEENNENNSVVNTSEETNTDTDNTGEDNA